MKVKPARTRGKVVVELGAGDQALLEESTAASSFKLRTILVPLDFSGRSRKALRYALPLARQFEASVHLVHVVQLSYAFGEFGTMDYPRFEADMKAEAEKQLAELAATEIGNQVPFSAQVRVGRPATEIVQAARETDADLVVIATHGHSGVKHVLLGSVAENVVRHAPCPVLTVREQERDFVAT